MSTLIRPRLFAAAAVLLALGAASHYLGSAKATTARPGRRRAPRSAT